MKELAIIENFKNLFLAAVLLVSMPGAVAGEVSDNFRISSEHMGYDIQYRVYTPKGIVEGDSYPVLFVTDGELYLTRMDLPSVADELITSGAIRKAFIVFVDSSNPDDPRESRRNTEFMCNADYLEFYNEELLPSLYARYPISQDRNDTNILGLSFGGLNSACFGVMNSQVFSGIGMHSPANADFVREVSRLYQQNETEPLRFFISSGTRNDNLASTRRLRDVLEKKGYEITYIENRGARHNLDNWRALLDDALLALLPRRRSR